MKCSGTQSPDKACFSWLSSSLQHSGDGLLRSPSQLPPTAFHSTDALMQSEFPADHVFPNYMSFVFFFPLDLPVRHGRQPSRTCRCCVCVARCVRPNAWMCVCVCVGTSSREQSCCCTVTLWEKARQQINQVMPSGAQVRAQVITQFSVKWPEVLIALSSFYVSCLSTRKCGHKAEKN